MCRKYLKKLIGKEEVEPRPNTVEDSSPRTDEHTPSSDYLKGRMPTYEVVDLIAHLRYRILIHETYWGLVEDNPAKWRAFGNADFHQWAIEGYENAIYYIERCDSDLPSYDRLGLYGRRMNI